ncbi:MAG: DNA polymerase III subunit delta [Treponema sp.]|nr:DNA polymerase III subunit delta [Treponema sp.]
MSAPLYLFTGPELGNRNDAVQSVKNSLKKKFGEIDEHLFYLSETPFSQVMTILQSGTLFSNGVCVVCRYAEVLKKKEELQMISDWLSNAEESSVLILISDEISVDSKLEKLVPAENRKKFWEMFESDKIPWVSKYFSQNGYKIGVDACQMILDMVENNTQALKNECSRFFLLFPKGAEITPDDVDSVLTNTREESPFTLFNHLANPSIPPERRLEEALVILQKIRFSKENSSVQIISLLASCYRKVVLWHQLCNEGLENDEGAMRSNGFTSTTMRKLYKKAAKLWTIGQATAILANLASADMEIRSSGTLLEDVVLQKVLYEIVIKKGAQLSVAEYSD